MKLTNGELEFLTAWRTNGSPRATNCRPIGFKWLMVWRASVDLVHQSLDGKRRQERSRHSCGRRQRPAPVAVAHE